MLKIAKITVVTAAVCAMLTASACRTKTKPAPKVEPTTTTAETVAPPVEAPPTQVEEPKDFVSPTVQSEDLPADIESLNSMAQQKGWLRDAFFNFDESSLTSEGQDALSASATWLKAHPQYNLLVEGHCDERGTEQYNLALGDRRANIAKDYLGTLGVDASRIRTVSYGEERPFANGHDESSWSQNRRAHLVIVGK